MTLNLKYKLPIKGRVLNDAPLTGDEADPLSIIPLGEISGFPKDKGLSYVCLSYDVDAGVAEVEVEAEPEVHDWLLSQLPKLSEVAKDKDWKLDKSVLEQVRLAREDIKLEK